MQQTTLQQQKNVSPVKPHGKYRNIIFDLGGVLVYFNPKELIANIFKNEESKPWELLNAHHTRPWLEMDRGTMNPDQVGQALAEQYPQEKLVTYIKTIPQYLLPLPQGLEIFDAVRAKGYRTYVLSNMSEQAHKDIVMHHDFIKKFDGTIFSYEVQAVKPDPDIYQILLNSYELKPEECLFIDDLEVNINAGKSLGIDGIICQDHKIVKEELIKLGVLD